MAKSDISILDAAVDEYDLKHSSEGDIERIGRRHAIRGLMVRLGLYDQFVARLAATSPSRVIPNIIAK